MLLLLGFPILGIILYLLTGQEIPRQSRKRWGMGQIGMVTEDNQVTVFTTGDEKFQALVQDMKEAKEYIYLQYYIIKNDMLFAQLKELLVIKVQEGVEVRLLYDSFGCRTVRKKDWNILKKQGIWVQKFVSPFFQKFFLRFNYRNHRKLVIIDNHIGYLGGYNIGKEYIGMEPRFGPWRDTHIRIQGSAVNSLKAVFLHDWEKREEGIHGKEKEGQHFCRTHRDFLWNSEKRGTVIQIITSGPDSPSAHIRNTYVRLIMKAEEQIYIQTPYFIPDEPILTALKMALLAGRKVYLMIPCKPDHLFVYWATYSYVGELVELGANVYIYEKGFLHAKGIMIDEKAYCYGTANMDIRSFALNYEVNAIVYGEKETRDMIGIFEQDILCCRKIDAEEYCARSMKIRIKEQICRLLSPLL